jgi:hypothetical protein
MSPPIPNPSDRPRQVLPARSQQASLTAHLIQLQDVLHAAHILVVVVRQRDLHAAVTQDRLHDGGRHTLIGQTLPAPVADGVRTIHPLAGLRRQPVDQRRQAVARQRGVTPTEARVDGDKT